MVVHTVKTAQNLAVQEEKAMVKMLLGWNFPSLSIGQSMSLPLKAKKTTIGRALFVNPKR